VSQVRSTVLAAINLTDTAVHDVLTCPAGVSYIVKNVSAIVTAATAGTVSVWVARPSGVSAYLLRESLNSLAPKLVDTGVVMQPGDILRVNTGTSPTMIWISGSRLAGVAVFP
jgi:hypothetical protein